MKHKKTALLIYCTRAEADQIRFAAKQERRTITGFVMNSVMNRVIVHQKANAHLQAVRASSGPAR